jgi:hypothetical protein
MNEFLKMDIFFFVTTIAVVVLTALTGFVLYRLNRVFKSLQHILTQVSAETDMLREDFAEIRSDMRQGTGRIKSLFKFFNRKGKRVRKNS